VTAGLPPAKSARLRSSASRPSAAAPSRRLAGRRSRRRRAPRCTSARNACRDQQLVYFRCDYSRSGRTARSRRNKPRPTDRLLAVRHSLGSASAPALQQRGGGAGTARPHVDQPRDGEEHRCVQGGAPDDRERRLHRDLGVSRPDLAITRIGSCRRIERSARQTSSRSGLTWVCRSLRFVLDRFLDCHDVGRGRIQGRIAATARDLPEPVGRSPARSMRLVRQPVEGDQRAVDPSWSGTAAQVLSTARTRSPCGRKASRRAHPGAHHSTRSAACGRRFSAISKLRHDLIRDPARRQRRLGRTSRRSSAVDRSAPASVLES